MQLIQKAEWDLCSETPLNEIKKKNNNSNDLRVQMSQAARKQLMVQFDLSWS